MNMTLMILATKLYSKTARINNNGEYGEEEWLSEQSSGIQKISVESDKHAKLPANTSTLGLFNSRASFNGLRRREKNEVDHLFGIFTFLRNTDTL